MQKTIGVLTSGGDAPGMNAAVRAVTRAAIKKGFRVVGIRRGYNGLLNNDMVELTTRDVADIIQRGGTEIFTARCKEFREWEYVLKAKDICVRDNFAGIVVIGGDGSYRGTKLAAKNETAMDNSPMYDEASFDKASGLLEMYDVGVSSQLALDLECTAYMATLLGKESDREELASAAEELRFAINEQLWDEEKGIYANRNTDGTFGLTSPTSFYPLAAGVADSDRVDKCLSHIFNEEEFFTPFPLIAINASHPSGHENRYWRGRTWAPQPFWTYIGLRRCGRCRECRNGGHIGEAVFFHLYFIVVG